MQSIAWWCHVTPWLNAALPQQFLQWASWTGLSSSSLQPSGHWGPTACDRTGPTPQHRYLELGSSPLWAPRSEAANTDGQTDSHASTGINRSAVSRIKMFHRLNFESGNIQLFSVFFIITQALNELLINFKETEVNVITDDLNGKITSNHQSIHRFQLCKCSPRWECFTIFSHFIDKTMKKT